MESKEHREKSGQVIYVFDLSGMARRIEQVGCRVYRQEKTIRTFAWILFGLIISNFILGLLALESILKGVG